MIAGLKFPDFVCLPRLMVIKVVARHREYNHQKSVL
jgi:hypothetical protein